eukprot:scaffold172_cov341-Pavlova_lutheri.AAC.32
MPWNRITMHLVFSWARCVSIHPHHLSVSMVFGLIPLPCLVSKRLFSFFLPSCPPTDCRIDRFQHSTFLVFSFLDPDWTGEGVLSHRSIPKGTSENGQGSQGWIQGTDPSEMVGTDPIRDRKHRRDRPIRDGRDRPQEG